MTKIRSSLGTTLVALTLTACRQNPVQRNPVVTQSEKGSIAPHATVCASSLSSTNADVSATVTPPSLALELRSGFCKKDLGTGDAGTLAGRSTGTLKIAVPFGDYHVDITNTSNVDVSYSLTVEFTFPAI